MVLLTGSHLQTMDERLRLAVPSKLVPALRELAGIGENDPLDVVVSVTTQQRLGIYTRKYFDAMMAELSLTAATDLDAEELRLAYLNYMDEQTLDKQNRFRIPQMHAEAFELSGEVVVLGSGDYLEVVSKKAWKEQLQQRVPLMRSLRERLRQSKGEGV